jgi:hypothetical protein
MLARLKGSATAKSAANSKMMRIATAIPDMQRAFGIPNNLVVLSSRMSQHKQLAVLV